MDPLRGLMGNRGIQDLMQYPDVKLYNAAKLLKPEDRPTAPVRLYEIDSKKFPALRGREKSIGGTIFMAPPGNEKRSIFVNKRNPVYEKGELYKLAGIMAHEEEHLRRQDFEESPAYRKEYEAVRDIRGADPRYIQALLERTHVNRAIR